MKSIKLLILAIFLLSASAFAQKSTAKVIIQTPGLQCEVCKNRVETYLLREEGVQTVKADYKRHTVSVSYFKDRTNVENLKTSLANLGYDADDVAAEPDSYRRLPATCKHAVIQTAKP